MKTYFSSQWVPWVRADRRQTFRNLVRQVARGFALGAKLNIHALFQRRSLVLESINRRFHTREVQFKAMDARGYEEPD